MPTFLHRLPSTSKFNCESPAYHYNPTVHKGIQLQWVFHWSFHITTLTWDYSSQNISIWRELKNHMVNLSVNWHLAKLRPWGAHYIPQSILAGNLQRRRLIWMDLKGSGKNHCTRPSPPWHHSFHLLRNHPIPSPAELSTLLSPTTVPCNTPSSHYPQ